MALQSKCENARWIIHGEKEREVRSSNDTYTRNAGRQREEIAQNEVIISMSDEKERRRRRKRKWKEKACKE